MALIAFTKNYTDRSNDTGYQFEFHCDKCGNGHMTRFQTSKMGLAESFLKAAGSFFGGNVSRAAAAGDHLKDAYRGKAWDDAYASSVEEAKQHFKQCSRCGKWVCPEHCWNASRGLCEECAPNLQEEAAAAQAQAAKEQVWDKAKQSDQTGGMDVSKPVTAGCPHCGAKAASGKFCPECGKPLAQEKFCADCGAKMPETAKFCPGCGKAAAPPKTG
ncbi:MAG: zinc ribbon domain-containing protein [Planctomycetes bacterium]|nr:zinc ribbon domain-containing protein [Planctomycetota bacterium]